MTFFHENIQKAGKNLIVTVHIDHMCLVSKTWLAGNDSMCWVSKTRWVGLESLGFGCWLGNLQKYIFFDIIIHENMLPLDGETILSRWYKYWEEISN